MTFKKCHFDHVGDNTVWCYKDKNIEFDSCWFASNQDYEKLQNSGADFKHCMVFDKKQQKWEVVNDKQRKQEKVPEIKKVATRDM